MMFTDDPAMDAERYDEEMEAIQKQQEAATPECCICHRKILDGTAYDFGEGIFAHEKCVDEEFSRINPELADAAKDALWEARARDKQTDELDVVTQALKNLNIKWCQEDLEGILEDADIPVTQGNLERLCEQITDGFHGILIEETNEKLQFLALDMKTKEKKAKEKKAAEKGDSCTRAWKVYGREGQPQYKSFSESHTYDFSDEYDGTRIISVLNSDKTETNDYTIIKIIRNTREECAQELDGQLSDGVFENSDVGKVVEIDPVDLPQSEN